MYNICNTHVHWEARSNIIQQYLNSYHIMETRYVEIFDLVSIPYIIAKENPTWILLQHWPVSPAEKTFRIIYICIQKRDIASRTLLSKLQKLIACQDAFTAKNSHAEGGECSMHMLQSAWDLDLSIAASIFQIESTLMLHIAILYVAVDKAASQRWQLSV